MSFDPSDEKKAALAARFGLTPPQPPAEAGPGRRYRHQDAPMPPRQAWQLCPGQGMGPLKLGMTPEELETALGQARQAWAPAGAPEMEKHTDMALPGVEGVTRRYLDDHAFFLVRYAGGRAVEIAADRMTAGRVDILLGEVPVFAGTAEETARELGLRQGPEGCTAPGLRLWQECPCKAEPFSFAAVCSLPPIPDHRA